MSLENHIMTPFSKSINIPVGCNYYAPCKSMHNYASSRICCKFSCGWVVTHQNVCRCKDPPPAAENKFHVAEKYLEPRTPKEQMPSKMSHRRLKLRSGKTSFGGRILGSRLLSDPLPTPKKVREL